LKIPDLLLLSIHAQNEVLHMEASDRAIFLVYDLGVYASQ
jgi:hypothetical protein